MVFPGFGQIELLNVAWVLQEPGDVGPMDCTRSEVKVDYFMIPYTSIFIRSLICTTNAMSFLLLLQMMGRGEVGQGMAD